MESSIVYIIIKMFLIIFYCIISILSYHSIHYHWISQNITIRRNEMIEMRNDSISIGSKDNHTMIQIDNHSINRNDKKGNGNINNPIINKTNVVSTTTIPMTDKIWIDSKFAERLRQAQKNNQYALVNDIIVTKMKKNLYSICIILNNGNTKGYLRYNNDVNVILYVGNRTYKNRFNPFREYTIRLLKYEVNDLPQKGHISLFDSSTSFKYKDLPYQMIPIPSKKKRIAICAYISSFNTIPEIKHWIAYYMIQHVDNLILYCAEPIDKFIKALHKSIKSGFVILYHYSWPLTHAYGLSQRSIQHSQINSCFYRHRDFYEYIISQDVDEYFYSEKYPFDLYHAIRDLYALHSSMDSFQVGYSFTIICRFLHFYILEEEIEKNHFLEVHYSMISQFGWIIENLEDQNK